jgi:probable HAF family extracellular repeat protein
VPYRPLLPLIAALALTSHDPESATDSNGEGPAAAALQERIVARIDLGTLGGLSSYATSINDHGVVVGWSLTSTGVSRAFRWTDSTGMVDLGTLPGNEWSRALSISEEGRILGVSGARSAARATPVIWERDGRITIPLIPVLPDPPAAKPVHRAIGASVVELDAEFGYAVAINDRGTAAGAAYDPADDAVQATIWLAAGGALELEPDDPFPSVAVGINESGVITGWRSLDCCGKENHAMLWRLGRAPARPAPMTGPVAAMNAAAQAAPGIDECLTDPRSVRSRSALFECAFARDRTPASEEEEGFDQPAAVGLAMK